MAAVEKSMYVGEFLPTTDFEGKHTLAFIVKRSYTLDTFEGKLVPEEEQEPVLVEDEPWDDGDVEPPSVKREAEFVPFRPKVDVVFVGKAYAPGGEPTPEFECGLRVGEKSARLRIVGPRRCIYQEPHKEAKVDKKTGLIKEEAILTPPLFTDPEPVTEVELRMANAYGGFSYVIPEDDEEFKQALEDHAKAEEEKEEKKKEEAEKKAEEEKKKAEEEANKPENFFSDGEDAELSDEEDDETLDSAGIPEGYGQAGHELKSEIDLSDWGKAGTAGEPPKAPRDGATMAVSLEDLEAELEGGEKGDAESSYLADTTAKAAEEVETLAEDGGTKALRIGEMIESGGDDWAGEESERLKSADAEYLESLGAKREEENEVPETWVKINAPQNPAGKGFALENRPETIDGLELPLIEDPARPLTPEDIPRDLQDLMERDAVIMPAHLGVFPKIWWPRTLLCGVMPADMEAAQQAVDEQVVELDPEDEDQAAMAEHLVDFDVPPMRPAYYNGAASRLQFDKLRGDERVVLTNLDTNGTTLFNLPGDYPLLTLDRGRGVEPVELRLDTLVIDRESEKVAMLWRGYLPYGGPEEFETYRKFELDVAESDVAAYQEELDRQAIANVKAGSTKSVDISELELEEDDTLAAYRDKVDLDAGGAAKAAALASGVAIVEDGGTKSLDLSELGEEKVVSDSAFDEWIDEAQQEEEEELDHAEALKKKKKALKKRLEEKKAKEEAEAAAAEEDE